jgi:hypothetical protein
MAMRSFLVRRLGLFVSLVACATANRVAGAAAGSTLLRPEAVSPGELDHMVRMGKGCFTFSWAAVDGARGFELAVHHIDSGAADLETTPAPALQVRVPATLSWTPSLERCLAPGRYAWVVRAQTAAGWSDWSEPRLFEVRGSAPAAPPPAAEPERKAAAVAILDGRSPAGVQLNAAAPEPPYTPAAVGPRSVTGSAFAPPSCNGSIFSDVTAGTPNCAWIELLAADQIAQPCDEGRFCPDQPVTRGQVAALLERSMRGTDAWRAEQGDGAVPNLPPAPPGITPLDTQGATGGAVGQYSSITIGTDGLGLISYWDASGVLTVAHCSNVICSEATITEIDPEPFFTFYTSITIGADGFGLISYLDALNRVLRVAHCANVECTAVDAITSVTPTTINLGQYSSITIGGDGLGLISFYDATFGRLWAGHCTNVQCTGFVSNALTAPGIIGKYTSIAIAPDGLGLISYYDDDAGGVLVSHCAAANCAAADVTGGFDAIVDTGKYTSITIGPDGLPLISYYDGLNFDLKVAHCANLSCSGGGTIMTALDTAGDVGQYTSITIGADGLGLISYYDVTNGDLKIAHCANTDCTVASISKLDTAGDVGQYSSITIGADGLGLISYYDATNGDLKVAHCSNLLCAPYFRRR